MGGGRHRHDHAGADRPRRSRHHSLYLGFDRPPQGGLFGSSRRRFGHDELRLPDRDDAAAADRARRSPDRPAQRAGGGAAVPRHGRGPAVPAELRHGPQAGADAQVGCDQCARTARPGTDHLFRRRAADELRDRGSPGTREIRSVAVQDLCRRRCRAPDRTRQEDQGCLQGRLPRAGVWPDRDQRRRRGQSQRELSRQAQQHRHAFAAAGRHGDSRRRWKAAAAGPDRRGLDPLGVQLPRLLEERGCHQGGLFRRCLFPHW